MQLVIIPFHDWRKNCKEGFRTRDAHFIKEFEKNKSVSKILIVNRPTTFLEIILKYFSFSLKGKIIKTSKNFRLIKINDKVYIVDYISKDFINQILNRYRWVIKKYQDNSYLNFINECLTFLQFNNQNYLIQNVFAGGMTSKFNSDKIIFDAWDNFLKFPIYSKIRKELIINYNSLALNAHFWMTNSIENRDYFKSKFKVKNITLLKNGVSENLFNGDPKIIPNDLKNIKKPIVGFGGKVTYLLNTELLDYLVKDNPDYSFVLIGQKLDKSIFKKLPKTNNFYYLGDKHYDDYPDYVKNFNILIVPYRVKENQHGGDSIKAYEYLATGKKVIGTRGNGLEDLEEYLYISDSFEEFSNEIKNYKKNDKKEFELINHSWEGKSKFILELMNK